MNNPKWTWATLGFMTLWAYVMAFLFYNIGGLITGDVAFGVGPVIGILLIGCLIFLLFRKGYQPENGVKSLTAVKANN